MIPKTKEFQPVHDQLAKIEKCCFAFFTLAPDRLDFLVGELEDFQREFKNKIEPVVRRERSARAELPERDRHGCPAGTVPCQCGCCPPQWTEESLEAEA